MPAGIPQDALVRVIDFDRGTYRVSWKSGLSGCACVRGSTNLRRIYSCAACDTSYFPFKMSGSELETLRRWEIFADIGTWMVIVGVFGEGLEIGLKLIAGLSKESSKPWMRTCASWHHKHEVSVDFVGGIFWLIVVAGLAMEFEGNHKVKIIEQAENTRLNTEAGNARKDAAVAIERAANVESHNLVLQKQVFEAKAQWANAEARLNESVTNLELINSPIEIGDQYSLVQTLKEIPGVEVKLRCLADLKAQHTEESLFSVFYMAQWPVVSRSTIHDIGKHGVVIGYNDGDISGKTSKAALLLLDLLIDRGVPATIISGMGIRGVPTNAIIVGVFDRPTPTETEMTILNGKISQLDRRMWPLINKLIDLQRNHKYSTNGWAQAEIQEFNNSYAQVNQLQSERMTLERHSSDDLEPKRRSEYERHFNPNSTNRIQMIDTRFGSFFLE